MSRSSWIKAAALALGMVAFGGAGSAQAQDWTDYLHWPYVPPQVPGNGFEYNALHDQFYTYPREKRIVPQIQGPYYRNYYGGKRLLGLFRVDNEFCDWSNKRFYKGYHFFLDVF